MIICRLHLRKILFLVVYYLQTAELSCFPLGNSVTVIPGRAKAPPCLLLAQLFMGAGLPAGAFNVLTGCDILLAAKVAQSSSISYVTYAGNKQVCACARARPRQ